MRTRTLHKLVLGVIGIGFGLLPVFVFLAPDEASGSDTAMLLLPASSKYRCTSCHATETPTIESNALTAFGQDFKDNGSQWDAELAEANSDGDRCSNGFELGDRDGDGVMDDPTGERVENSNPGDPNDCTVPVDRRTWGIIKDMFRSEMLEFSSVQTPNVWLIAYSP